MFQNNVAYMFVGQGSAPDYFSVEERGGAIKVKQALKDDPHKLKYYIVSSRKFYK